MIAAITRYRERRGAHCVHCTRPVPEEAVHCPAWGLRVGSRVRPCSARHGTVDRKLGAWELVELKGGAMSRHGDQERAQWIEQQRAAFAQRLEQERGTMAATRRAEWEAERWRVFEASLAVLWERHRARVSADSEDREDRRFDDDGGHPRS